MILIFMMMMLSTSNANPLKVTREDGQIFGHKEKARALLQIEHFPSKELLPFEQRGESFDAKKAKECAEKKHIPRTDSLDFLQSTVVQQNQMALSDTEYFLERSESISQNAQLDNLEVKEALDYHFETCQQREAPYPIAVIRDLEVKVAHDPGETKEMRVCCRHEYKRRFQHKKDAEKKVKELKRSLSLDPTIAWYQVDGPKGGGLLHRYIVEAYWEHHDDALTCQLYQTQVKQIRAPEWDEIGEDWVYENQSLQTLGKTPDCSLIQSECLDTTPSKIINGKEVSRQCWKEKLTFLCRLPHLHGCPYAKNQNCELINKECINESPFGCSLWELTFKCYSTIVKREIGVSEFYGLDEEHPYEPNDSFSEIAAKLAVFDAMKQDLENSQSNDARAVQIFKGKRMQCSKSIADKVMYDCCFSYAGLAKEMGLTQCNADEIALAQMRENGLCHYVGSYEAKFCDLWKSRDEHVFCCFDTKLARILQEHGRGQLNLGWDSPKHANCRGLTIDEISHLDLSKMDFSELYSDYQKKLPENFQNKLESFENRLKEKVKQHDETTI